MSETYPNQNEPDPEYQYLQDLANAKQAVNEGSQKIYEDIEEQRIADIEAEGKNVGDEAEEYLKEYQDDGGVAEQLAGEATTYLKLHDRMTGKEFADGKTSFASLVQDGKYVEEIRRQIDESRGDDFRDMKRDYEPPEDQ